MSKMGNYIMEIHEFIESYYHTERGYFIVERIMAEFNLDEATAMTHLHRHEMEMQATHIEP